MIKSRSYVFVLALLLTTVGGAKAFQETIQSEAPAGVSSAPASPDDDESVLGLDEEADDGTTTSDGEPSTDGAAKFNFGLELLYGGKSQSPSQNVPADDDVGLKGRLKHTF
jgi:hypothetical protein